MLLVIDVSAQQQYGYFNYEKVENSLKIKVDAAVWLNDYEKQLNDSATIYERVLLDLYKNSPHSININLLRHWDSLLNKAMIETESYYKNAFDRYLQQELFLKKEIKQSVKSAILYYCRAKKISFLANKEAVLYCEDCKDYTEELVNYIYCRE